MMRKTEREKMRERERERWHAAFTVFLKQPRKAAG
jgi:hypothetical protein